MKINEISYYFLGSLCMLLFLVLCAKGLVYVGVVKDSPTTQQIIEYRLGKIEGYLQDQNILLEQVLLNRLRSKKED
jgi:predicted GIY-YIG superfamily endonuclease